MWVENTKKSMVIETINQVWSSDFTHLYFKWIEFYLATVLDEYSKKIVWYTIASHHEKEVVFSALESAVEKEQATPQIQHSDQWSEYRSHAYFTLLERYNISASMSKKAAPWENGAQESFYWKLKFELWDLNRYNSLEEVIEAIHLHIYYYNNSRIHTALKMSPMQFIEQQKILYKNT
jgi:putative transposase